MFNKLEELIINADLRSSNLANTPIRSMILKNTKVNFETALMISEAYGGVCI